MGKTHLLRSSSTSIKGYVHIFKTITNEIILNNTSNFEVNLVFAG